LGAQAVVAGEIGMFWRKKKNAGPRPRRVFIVDADEFLLCWLGDYLAAAGFEVVTTTSGEEALRQMKYRPPDLIIMDFDLPGMGGIGFLKAISVARGRLRYPVLVLTARPGVESFCQDLGVDGLLRKTAYGRELGQKILEILRAHDARVAPALAEEPAAAKRPRVLLAEDEEPVAAHVRRFLENAGFEVTVVGSGPQVVESAVALAPDVIVLKEFLPGMNGSAVAVTLGQWNNARQVPIVLYDETSSGDMTSVRAKARGHARVCLSTASPRALLAAVGKCLGHGRAVPAR
jgi:DNA-binding response OmpR family regulator